MLRVIRDLTTDQAIARVWEALLEKAAEGDVSACRVVLDRVLGPNATLADVAQDGDVTGDVLLMLLGKVKGEADGN